MCTLAEFDLHTAIESHIMGSLDERESQRRGLLKSLMTWAIPLSVLAIRSLIHSVLFGSLCR